LLIPPLALKVASTGYRFARYYTSAPAYREAGPPPWPIRLLAPIVVLSTAALFISGLELWFFGLRFGSAWVGIHKLSFLVWVPATGVHVLWHLRRSAKAAGEEISPSPPAAALTRRGLVLGTPDRRRGAGAGDAELREPVHLFPGRGLTHLASRRRA
jgi:hypothetical protein